MLKLANSLLWAIATIFIVAMGIYYTFSLKFVQFRFKEMFKNLFKKESNNSISPFASLMIVLGGRIGVGSIAGIALAIYLGGVGSIFWMWVFGLISIPLSFAETVLGVKYKEKDGDYYKGGPSFYLRKGLNKPILGGIYALLIIASYVGGFLGIQSNTISRSVNVFATISPLVIGFIVSTITFLIILGGIKKIANACSKIVPIMTLLYVLSAFYILIKNVSSIPTIMSNILSSALNFKSFGSGLIGTIIIGLQRGIFSNEAGLGSGAIAASTTDGFSPASQGFVQMIGIYITTFLICTSTAIIIITAPEVASGIDINGIEVTQLAFIYHLDNLGNIIVFVSIILFAFSTILAGYYDGEISLKYFSGNISNKYINILKMVSLFIIFIGSIVSSTFLWNLVDILTALLAIINIYALYVLRDEVKDELRKYEKCGTIKRVR